MKAIACVTTVLLLAIILPANLSAQDSQTGERARKLVRLMASQKLGAVAARDPDSPDRFVAALVFPKVQLLVVSARYAAPLVLREELSKKQYEEVYAALQTASIPDSRVFFQDLNADGLHAKPGASGDVMCARSVNQTSFDGNPARHDLSQAVYAEKCAAADMSYSRLLDLLIGELRTAPQTR